MNKDVLKNIAKGLNDLSCTWAIGGSVMLSHYDLVKRPNDIDILIDASHADKVKEFMDSIGTYIPLPSKSPFKTEEFFGYIVDDIMVEFLGDFKIELENGKLYEFILDDKAIREYMFLDNVKVNLSTLEDWFVAYSVMNDPKNRVPLLKNYFINNGIQHRDLLERNMSMPLPIQVQLDIESIL